MNTEKDMTQDMLSTLLKLAAQRRPQSARQGLRLLYKNLQCYHRTKGQNFGHKYLMKYCVCVFVYSMCVCVCVCVARKEESHKVEDLTCVNKLYSNTCALSRSVMSVSL